jgi:type II secretory pathway pseudopilin PulG
MKRSATSQKRGEAGFSLIELGISMLILVIVMGAVFSQINQIQKKTKVESLKLDLTQESREFMDQFARDLHMSGYPTSKMYQNFSGLPSSNYALGLVMAKPSELRFEADIVGDGTVYSVSYKYFASDVNDPNCPCVRRAVTPKDSTVNPVTGYPNAVYYTEIQNVIDPTGMAQGVFTYFQASGDSVDVGSGVDINSAAGQATIQQIDAIKANLNTRSLQFDPHTGQRTVVNSMATIAELEN